MLEYPHKKENFYDMDLLSLYPSFLCPTPSLPCGATTHWIKKCILTTLSCWDSAWIGEHILLW